MKVTDFKVKKGPKNTVFSAQFSFRNKILNQKVWFMIPNKYSKKADIYNPFFVVAVPLALTLGEDLLFEGEVSAKLYRNLSSIDDYLNLSYRQIRILTKGLVVKKEEGKKVALFFSLGSDSFYSLVDNKKSPNKEQINYLMFIWGIENFKPSNKLTVKLRKGVALVAKKSRTSAIFAETNIRSLSDKLINWELYHGAAIAACGLFFSPLLKKIYISGCDKYVANKMPYGTGRNIDYQWSTEGLKFEPYAEDTSKADKGIELSRSSYIDLIKKYLWVCWQKIDDENLINCSKCEKCIRVYLSFRAGGIIDPIPALAKPRLSDVRKIHITDDRLITYKTIFDNLKINHDENKKIIKVLEEILLRQKKDLFIERIDNERKMVKTMIKKLYLRYATMLYDKLINQHDHF